MLKKIRFQKISYITTSMLLLPITPYYSNAILYHRIPMLVFIQPPDPRPRYASRSRVSNELATPLRNSSPLTFEFHSDDETLLESAIGAAFPLSFIYRAVLLVDATVDLAILNCTLEEPYGG